MGKIIFNFGGTCYCDRSTMTKVLKEGMKFMYYKNTTANKSQKYYLELNKMTFVLIISAIVSFN